MIKKITNLINKFLASLDTVQGNGMSARKITAMVSVLTGVYITRYQLPQEAQLHALYAWQGLALLCLGIVTIEQVIKLKNGNVNEPQPKPEA